MAVINYKLVMDKFIFPVSLNDLQRQQISSTRYRVLVCDLQKPQKQLIEQFRRVDKDVAGDCRAVETHFDFLYSVIRVFTTDGDALSPRLLQELSHSMEFIGSRTLQATLASDSAPQFRTVYKMSVFLCLYFLNSTLVRRVKQLPPEIMNEGKGKRRVRNEAAEVPLKVVRNQIKVLGVLRQSLGINFSTLFEKKEVDGQFFKKYIDVCVRVLESTLLREDTVLDGVIDLLELILANEDSLCGNFQTVLANLVYEGEVVENLLLFFARVSGVQLQKICTQALALVVVYLTNKQNISTQSQSIRNTHQFLSRLSEKIPKVFYTNLSCFIGLFKQESYILRNTISDILMNILKQGMEQTEVQEKFIATLLQRIYDKSPFSRTHILMILGELVVAKVVARKHMILFLKAGIDRLKDHSSLVRKRGLQLINTLINEVQTKAVTPFEQIQEELKMAEMEMQTLNEEEQRLKREMQLIDEEDKLQEIVDEIKVVKKRARVVQQRQFYYIQQREVSMLLDSVLETAKLLLCSKSDSDVLETIRLVHKMYKLNFIKARSVLPDLRLLIFSKEKKIREEIILTFTNLHLTNRSQDVARELINLFAAASLQDRSALQQILQYIFQDPTAIKPQCFMHMWNQFIGYEQTGARIEEKRAIMTILRIAFSKDHSLIRQEYIESFLNILKKKEQDYHILKQISRVACLDSQIITKYTKTLLMLQIYTLVNSQGTTDREWYSACEAVLNCVYQVCDSPEKISEMFIHRLHQTLIKNVAGLPHFIFALSHNCLKCLIYLDKLENKLKNQKQNDKIQEEELDKVMGGREAEIEKKVEEIQNLTERILQDSFIKRWVDIITKIVLNFKEGNELEVIAVLSYCKFMCISAAFCQKRFPHVLNILEMEQTHPSVKNNIIIAFGDLLHRFPNIIEPYSKYLYKNLSDKHAQVRKTTLTVITHLCLNDMIKAKGDLCDVALLFQDSDPSIVTLVKQFFHQMSKKDPRNIFGIIPEALARYSSVERKQDDPTFRIFFQHINPLLEKDKHSESLVCKLCQKIATSLNFLEIKNTVYCLCQINLNERCIRKIIQCFDSFKHTLGDNQIASMFRNMIGRLKRMGNPQLKNLVDEVQEKVNNYNEDKYNSEEVKKKNLEREAKKPRRKATKEPANSSTRSRKRRPKENEQDNKNEMEVEEISSEGEWREGREAKEVAVRVRPQRNVRRMKIIEESQEMQGEEEDYSEDD